MKKVLFTTCSVLLVSLYAIAQQPNRTEKASEQLANKKLGFGLKGGINFANVSNASSINAESRTGYMIAGFLSPFIAPGQGYRTEIVLSQQGYNFKTNTNEGNVKLNYLILPQLYTFNIGKAVQFQIGGQVAFLLNAMVDSLNTINGTNAYEKATDYYNKFDYGMAAGFELYPAKGLLIGARYNLSFAKTYNEEQQSNPSIPLPAFIPPKGTNGKNNVVSIFAGYRF